MSNSQVLLARTVSSDRLILGTDGETICLWEMERGPLRVKLLSNMKTVRFGAIATSQSENALAVAADQTLSVFEFDGTTATWRLMGQFPGEWSAVTDMEFTQDQRYLLTITADGVVKYVPLTFKDLINQACRYLARQPPESRVESLLAGFEDIQISFKCSFSP